jgi:hypothetical protein
LKKTAAGQKPVKADWMRFAPINAVNQMKYGETKTMSRIDRKIIAPAKAKIARSRVIIYLRVSPYNTYEKLYVLQEVALVLLLFLVKGPGSHQETTFWGK